MKTNRILELAGVLQEAAGGKREGAVNMIMAMLKWGEGGKLSHEQVRLALVMAYEAGMADAHKAASKNSER